MALWVMGGHICRCAGYSQDHIPILPLVLRQVLFSEGSAVEVFMILSGFVLARLRVEGAEPLGGYIFRRWVRLFPVFLVAFGMALILTFLGSAQVLVKSSPFWAMQNQEGVQALIQWPWHVVTHLTLLHGLVCRDWLAGSTGAILPPAWSISTEWQFYLAVPFLVWGFTCRGWRGVTVTVCAIVLVANRMGAFDIFTNYHAAFLGQQLQWFLTGMASYAIYRKLTDPWVGLMGAAVALLLVLLSNSLALQVWGVVWCLLLADRIFEGRAWKRGAWLLENRGIQCVGRVSYPIYLLHWPVIMATGVFVFSRLQHPPAWVALLVLLPTVLIVTGLLAWGVHYGLERPTIEWARRLVTVWKSEKYCR